MSAVSVIACNPAESPAQELAPAWYHGALRRGSGGKVIRLRRIVLLSTDSVTFGLVLGRIHRPCLLAPLSGPEIRMAVVPYLTPYLHSSTIPFRVSILCRILPTCQKPHTLPPAWAVVALDAVRPGPIR